MEQVQRLRDTQVTETNSASEFSAEIISIGESRFSVRIQRTEFVAEAGNGGGETTIRFDENTEVEEFSAGFVEKHYTRFIPAPWEVLLRALEVEEICTGAVPDSFIVAEPAADEEPASSDSALEGLAPNARKSVPRPSRDDPYELFEPNAAFSPYQEEAVDMRAKVLVERQVLDSAVELYTARRETGASVPVAAGTDLLREYEVPRANAAEVVQNLFQHTDLEGVVEKVEGYGLTEDFEGEVPEAYWVEVDGMDMDRTEYFINGELAGDAINHYELGPGDNITFVESDIFLGGPEESYCSETGSGTLRLEDALPSAENVESYDFGRTLMPAPAYTDLAS